MIIDRPGDNDVHASRAKAPDTRRRGAHPDLEVVAVSSDESFRIWSHGYPFKTVRWHFHPEYELHLVTNTHGRAFVADYIGEFGPGNLVLTGPNVPHNWLSDLAKGQVVSERGLVLQFSQSFAERILSSFPELKFFGDLLQEARRGVSFPVSVARKAESIMRDLLGARGPARLALFFHLVDTLSRSPGRRQLASPAYDQDPLALMATPMNHVLAYIAKNLGEELREGELAALSGQSVSSFSRQFQRATGSSFVRYVTEMRVKRACELLSDGAMRITDICFEVGFSNISNFNRRFRSITAMSPRDYRRYRRGLDEAPVAH